MSTLMRASEIAKRPVVTFDGEDIAEIKDIVYAAHGGHVGGFSLNGRSFFAGKMKTALPWASVAALGPDAVMVASEESLVPLADVLAEAEASGTSSRGDILGSQVLTEDGTALGKVVDVIIEVADNPGEAADVVGYEIEPSEGMGESGRLLIPLPDTLSASGEHLMVPNATREFVSHDLAGFGAAVIAFRARLEGQI
ncbi:PRC-barrel domain containing protein [Nakamurella antarctica]|uniref:PRC-barrel domain containing protein n=1 Tax=Nakamurella antarctica TaxID=1902245 RepID=A0A3G8ZJQ9_9ACTN|nr:PRC-barrel domain-containing protein [Nakamurella antarctica]AZI57592.1 PRC-barrel domain containing protein [Nakamurella antarctica]